jgi:ADP-heptose:LPS heptosyltransferase
LIGSHFSDVIESIGEMNIDLSLIKKILIIQIRPFGDVLLNTAYLPFLREKLPDAKIDFLVRHPYQEVLEKNAFLDDVIIFHKKKGVNEVNEKLKLFNRIRRNKYDLIIDQQQGTTSAQVAVFSGARYKISYADSIRRFAYNVRVKPKKQRYSASMKFDLLQPLGIKEQAYRFYYHIRPESMTYIDGWLKETEIIGKKIICISPGSPRKRKKWRADHYAGLADFILENTDWKIVLLWGPSEKDDIHEVAGLMKKKPFIAPPTDFNEGAAMLKRSELLICNDGGLNHLSVAVETPSLAIFGNTNPVNWAPDILGGHYYLFNPYFNSGRCNSFGISPETAWDKVRSIIDIF